ncbi:MAG: glutaminyl-peptide cyclotransferase [Candidatus Bathyarchaeota archaeon]|nr:glutaminyl-peptide cyclotransferase [Candidatus Bathyarchaeota archaeon]
MKQRIVLAAATVILACLIAGMVIWIMGDQTETAPVSYSYTVVNVFPHDENAFTQGLVFSGGTLFEGTGLLGESALREVDLETGEITREVLLPDQFFGEGIAVVGNRIVQLTWHSQTGFVYDRDSFALLANFSYPTEGWGLTYDGERLIMSDGSENLYFLDPQTFERTGEIQVQANGTAVRNLNELEYVNGEIYANIWNQQTIAIINPETGQVKSWIDISGLESASWLNPEKVPNGIAYDPANNRLFVTGKNWPNLYEITLIPSDFCCG